MTQVSQELLPCPSPWCDHRGFVATTDDDMFYGRAYQVQCTQCAMGGPVKRTEAEAITAWNTREAALDPHTLARALFAADREDMVERHPDDSFMLWDDPVFEPVKSNWLMKAGRVIDALARQGGSHD